MNKVGKSMMILGIGAASVMSYKFLVPKSTKNNLKDMAKNMIDNKNSSGNN